MMSGTCSAVLMYSKSRLSLPGFCFKLACTMASFWVVSMVHDANPQRGVANPKSATLWLKGTVLMKVSWAGPGTEENTEPSPTTGLWQRPHCSLSPTSRLVKRRRVALMILADDLGYLVFSLEVGSDFDQVVRRG